MVYIFKDILTLNNKKGWNISANNTNVFNKGCLFMIVILFWEYLLLFNRKNNLWTLFYTNSRSWFIYIIDIRINDILFVTDFVKAPELFNEIIWIFCIYTPTINRFREFWIDLWISLKEAIMSMIVNSYINAFYS